MTDPGPPLGPPDRDDDALAAEYALGLLDGDERDAFEARLREDRRLVALVEDWQERLSPLADEVSEVAPRAAVKVGVMDEVWGKAAPEPGLWRSLWLWRGLAFASLAGVAAMAWLLLEGRLAPEPGPIFVVEIAAEDGSLEILAAGSGADALRLARQAGAAPEGRVLELWAIAGDAAPVSLGVLPEDGEAIVEVPPGLRDALPGLVLAVSEEPPGGSPTGAPTGQVLAVGRVSEL